MLMAFVNQNDHRSEPYQHPQANPAQQFTKGQRIIEMLVCLCQHHILKVLLWEQSFK